MLLTQHPDVMKHRLLVLPVVIQMDEQCFVFLSLSGVSVRRTHHSSLSAAPKR